MVSYLTHQTNLPDSWFIKKEILHVGKKHSLSAFPKLQLFDAPPRGDEVEQGFAKTQ